MMARNDTYTGGEHYWIRFHNGTHEVRRETHESEPDNDTVFTGSYRECLKFLDETVKANVEYDLNL